MSAVVFKEESMGTGAKEEQHVPERIAKLKDRVLSSVYELDIERAKYYTEAYKRTEGQLPGIRAARGLEETLGKMTIRIDDEELIVGSKTAKKWGGPIYIEGNTGSLHMALATKFYKSEIPIEKALPDGFGGLSAEFLSGVPKISEEEYRIITEEIVPYWRDKTIMARTDDRWRQEGIHPDEALAVGAWELQDTIMLISTGQGHVTVGLNKVLGMGFRGIARQAAEGLAKLDQSDENYLRRRDFLESVQVAANAVCTFAERYARLAEKMAEKAEPQRKSELLGIAERCRRVPAEPPRNLMEAIQSIWLTQAAVIISYGDASITCPGRVDQYLYPFYKQDLEAGRITRDQALEAIMEYYLKLATNIYFGPNNVTIGGLDRKGENAVNEVSRLFLEAHWNLNGLRNGLAVRISGKTPRDFLLQACEMHRRCAGVALFNDEVVIRDLVENDGYPLEAARDYSIVGCVEPTGTGNNNGYTSSNGLLPVVLLEMALNEGERSLVGWKRAGAPTPPASQFKSFEDVKQAYTDQLSYAADLTVRRAYVKDQVIADNYPLPLLSSTIEGCVESATDVTGGGAKYNHGCLNGQALATVANSLAAIRWAVFDKKLLSMEELVGHLRNNFEGAEEVRQQLLSAPKFGNDDPYVDDLAVWVAETFNNEVTSHKFWMGGVHRACMVSAMTQDPRGRHLRGHPRRQAGQGRRVQRHVSVERKRTQWDDCGPAFRGDGLNCPDQLWHLVQCHAQSLHDQDGRGVGEARLHRSKRISLWAAGMSSSTRSAGRPWWMRRSIRETTPN